MQTQRTGKRARSESSAASALPAATNNEAEARAQKPRTEAEEPTSGSSAAPSPTAFSVLTYNILAQFMCTERMFPYSSERARDWDARRPLLLRDILRNSPDLICLQEVQSAAGPEFVQRVYSHEHVGWIEARLREAGYGSAYVRRRDASDMERDGEPQLGVLVAWKLHRFEIMRVLPIPVTKLVAEQCKDSPDLLQAFASRRRGCAALAVHLRDRVATHERLGVRRELVVGTTHLSAPRGEADLGTKLTQCIQMHSITRALEAFCDADESAKLPLVLAGDFNALPQSMTYDFLATGRIANDRGAAKKRVKQMLKAAGVGAGGVTFPWGYQMQHAFALQSAAVAALGGEPRHTNYTEAFKGCLDYVWYAHDRLVALPSPLSTLPPEEAMAAHTAMPSEEFASDHVPLYFVFDYSVGQASDPL